MKESHTTLSNFETTQSLKKQLPFNLISNFTFFLVNVFIGLFLVPFFISTLGIAAYGIIPLATTLNSYIGLFTESFNTAVSRYLTVDLRREDYTSANKTFNSAFFTISGIVLILVPIVALFSFFTPAIFNVPSGQEIEVICLFLGVTGAFLVRSWSGNFTVSLYAYNRLDIINYINIVNAIMQIVIILFGFSVFGPSLTIVGGAYLIAGISVTIIAFFLSRRVNPNLQININDFDYARLHNICETGWWVIVNNIGALLFLSTSLILVNIFFGAAATGEYAIALQWVVLLYAIAGTLSGVLTPIVLTYYAKEQTETLIKVSKSAVKLMGLFMALPIGLICGFSPMLLTIWVGQEYSLLAPLIVILTGNLAINLAVLPLFSINIAFNRVKIPGIVTLIMGIGNVLLAIILSLYTGWGYYGVAIAGAIVLTSKNAIFTPWYATRVLQVSKKTFFRAMLPGVIATTIIAICASIILFVFNVACISSLIIAGGILIIVYMTVLWSIGLNPFERGLFSSSLPRTIRRFVK